ncbi:hypothetical protein HDV00_005691 [Rhizophlyctis rosea]|nr:hypothetical protein HDV00_005691 [Rhizophlyctis rosea]
MRLSLLSLLTTTLLSPALALTSSLQEVTGFGTNPSGAKMYIYVPTKLANPPPIIVAIHYCSGTAQAYFSGTQWASQADQKGFIVVYPSSPRSGTCWDVASKASLTHNGGSDSLAIVSMAKYAKQKYGASNVYVTGSSSGAMMTNVLAGAYPDVFVAASAFSGVPDGCFADPSGATPASTATPYWNGQCSSGQVHKSPTEWASLVQSYYPGYTGPRPKFQIWHGSISIRPTNTQLTLPLPDETVKEWTQVLGVGQTPTAVYNNNPQTNYYKYLYGSQVEAIWAVGVGHGVPENVPEVIRFFGLSNLTPGGSGPTTTNGGVTTTKPATTTTTTTRVLTTTQAQGGNCSAK